MEVNTTDIMKYAIGGAALFVVIAIVIVTLFMKSKKRREIRKELEQKKKESYEVNQIKEEKTEKQVKVKQISKEQRIQVKKQEEVIPKQEVIVKQEEVLKQEVTAKQEEVPKQETVQLEKQSDKNPIHIAFYAVQATGREGNLAFSLETEINIGRDKHSNDWIIESDQTVSSRHCRIYQQGGAVYIQDMGSTNGTYVNSQRIIRATKLENHDKVRIGQAEYRVRC